MGLGFPKECFIVGRYLYDNLLDEYFMGLQIDHYQKNTDYGFI